MTVADLIAELKQYPPAKPVRVVIGSVYHADESGETDLPLCDDDATEADEVRNMGSHILIRGR